jgi:cytochrome c nitrite reductase small subunit
VMVPWYASWRHSSHARVATCNDCHVPAGLPIRALAFKARDGLRHSAWFTLRLEPEVLRLSGPAVPVVAENCRRCHLERMLEVAARRPGQAAGWRERPCWDCHRETPHGRVLSLSSAPRARRPPLPAAGLAREVPAVHDVPGSTAGPTPSEKTP